MTEDTSKHYDLKPMLWIFLIFIFLLPVIIPRILNPPYTQGIKIQVLNKFRKCFIAMLEYIDENKKYPSAENWQDILLPYLDNRKDAFELPTKVDTINTIALNPFADINSSNDIVLLFESTGGWNGHGQSELLAPTSNGRPGCFVLFNDGSTKFIAPEKIKDLNWGNKP